MDFAPGFLEWMAATDACIAGSAGRGLAKSHHAPKGGEDAGGKHYEGGQFVPGRDPDLEAKIVDGDVAAARIGEASATPAAARAWAMEHATGTHRNDDTGWDIEVSAKGIREALARLNWPPEIARGTVAAIPEIIRNAVLVHSTSDRKGRDSIHAVNTFVAPIVIKGTVYRARLIVNKTNMGHRYYGHHIESIDIEKPEALSVGGTSDESAAIRQPSGTIKLRHFLGGFKTK